MRKQAGERFRFRLGGTWPGWGGVYPHLVLPAGFGFEVAPFLVGGFACFRLCCSAAFLVAAPAEDA